MNKALNLWNKAKKIIPTGNSFLSKNISRFPVSKWPIYYTKSKGCMIWGLNNKKYYDFCLMGVGTNVLGYCNDKVDKAVIKNLRKGNMTTLNCPEEVYLAERLIKLHPWSNSVKFARTGAEINAIAIRLARAFTAKNKIIVCGYHGWHDWYLSANLNSNNNLETHLFPNLKTLGVPNELKKFIYSVFYNDFIKIKKIIKNDKDIACLIMEPQRDKDPKNYFLEKVRNICNKKNIVLIYDECTSGFRETYGGIHLKHKVYPDLATFGKALGNGYPITALIGKKKIMDMAKDTFISSTFWSERAGPTAAIATIDYMKKIKSWKILKKKSNYIKKKLRLVSEKNNLKINFTGTDCIIKFYFDNMKNNQWVNFLTTKMLEKSFLCNNTIYLSIAHSKKLIDLYIKYLDNVFFRINKIYLSEK